MCKQNLYHDQIASAFHKKIWIDTKYLNTTTYTEFSGLLLYGSIVIFINQVDRRINTFTQWVDINSKVAFISYIRTLKRLHQCLSKFDSLVLC